MAERIPNETAALWSQLATNLNQISKLAEDCRLIVLLQLNLTDGPALKAVEEIIDAASGQGYMFTPQTEWTGGDSSNPKNFKPTLHHIARK